MAFVAGPKLGCYVVAATAAVNIIEQQRRTWKTHRWQVPRFLDATHYQTACQEKPALCKREDFILKNSGDVYSEYTIEGNIGAGGYANVCIGIHNRTKIKRAVKRIPKTHTSAESFRAEVTALKKLDHPHIVELVEYFEDRDNFYLIQELCTGPDLVTYIEGKYDDKGCCCTSEKDISIIIRQCLKSVVYCHANAFIHRDIKLENYMITGEESTVKMIDFGLATRFLPSEMFTEQVGTFVYMAPELTSADAGGSGYSKAIDIWSLGVVFFALLTGKFLLPDFSVCVGGRYFVRSSNEKWVEGLVQSKNADGTYHVEIENGQKRRTETIKEEDIRSNEEEDVKTFLRDPRNVQKLLTSSSDLDARGASLDARNLLSRMLEHDPEKRITGAEALTHPFILKQHHNQLSGEEDILEHSFHPDIIDSLRRFADMPRLKQIALNTMVHLSSSNNLFSEELTRLQRTFRLLDIDGNGEISYSELETGLKDHKLKIPANFAQIYRSCDTNGSGTLTLVEFTAASLPSSVISKQLCQEVFRLLDRTYNGFIDADDFKLLFKSLKHKEHEYEEIITEAERAIPGKTLNGRLSFDEFHSFMRSDGA